MTEFFVGFHPRTTIPAAWSRREWTIFGHVEAWGCDASGVWWFLDPRAEGTFLALHTEAAEVEFQLWARMATCETILRVPYERTPLRVPFHPTMTCASQVGHLIGLRAYTPRSLRRRLLARGAEVIHDAQRGPSSEGRARA